MAAKPSASKGGAHRAPRTDTLVRRLVQAFSRAAAAVHRPRREVRTEAIAAPGQRSGEGVESITPYLQHGRSSRPGPLE